MLILTRYLKNYKKQIILGPLFKLLEAIFELIVPLVMSKIIDIGIINSNPQYVIKMGAFLIFLGITGLASAITCQYFASVASQGIGTDIRNDLFNHINNLSHSEIDKIGTPTLITRITNDVNQIQSAVAMFIRLAIRAPFLIIGSTIMAMTINLKLSVVFIIAIILITIVLYIIMSNSIPTFTLIQRKLDRISLITRENLEGVRVIRSFSKEESENERFYKASNTLSNISINVGKISSLLNPITFMIMNLAIVSILWFGGLSVNLGNLTQGQIIAFVNYMTNILLTLIVIANLVILFTKAIASIKRVGEILQISSSITERNETINNKIISKYKIEFKNVSFNYNDSIEKSLNNLSIKIEKGETIGIIGGTGSGKSTLVNLIPRFYDSSEGTISIDGIDIRDYSLKNLRTKISVVPQNPVLFSGTIYDNMRFGFKEATYNDIEKALNIAQASEFVNKLPEKYETIISQGGINLSGGQKQRLTIARALVNNPEILILDDSASALDFATDAKLRKAINEKTKDMTIIMVSQRASTIKNADKIIVLDGGEVQGIGSHNELMTTCPIYKEICLSQLNAEGVTK